MLGAVFHWGVEKKCDSGAHAPWEHMPEVVKHNCCESFFFLGPFRVMTASDIGTEAT